MCLKTLRIDKRWIYKELKTERQVKDIDEYINFRRRENRSGLYKMNLNVKDGL